MYTLTECVWGGEGLRGGGGTEGKSIWLEVIMNRLGGKSRPKILPLRPYSEITEFHPDKDLYDIFLRDSVLFWIKVTKDCSGVAS